MMTGYRSQKIKLGKLMLRHGLTAVQCQMAWILFFLNDFQCAARFVRRVGKA